jgi:hypothetical protein
MSKQVYYAGRTFGNVNGIFENVKNEFLSIFLTNKALLDAELNKKEEYLFNAEGFKILKAECEPYKSLECNHLLIVNDIVVGSVILRVSNNFATHGARLAMDSLQRTYELRFKTFAGCEFAVESSGIAVTQIDNGPMNVNSGTISGFADKILERHWAQFKDQCIFTATEIENPTKSKKYGQRHAIFARA